MTKRNMDGFGLGGLLGGLDKLMKLAAELDDAGGEINKTEEIDLGNRKAVFGVRVRTLSDKKTGGKNAAETFGNVRPAPASSGGPAVTDEREPITDVFDEAAEIKIYVELPGASEKDISVHLQGDILEIAVIASGKRLFYKEVLLPIPALAATSLRKTYNNGVLEIVIAKSV
ncbi:MAG: Hsp20/alpha crystallin family protein [Rhizobacter sp.]|nr:Hsp20/alpha crystallin family protein [Chlorobiales bacterium]